MFTLPSSIPATKADASAPRRTKGAPYSASATMEEAATAIKASLDRYAAEIASLVNDAKVQIDIVASSFEEMTVESEAAVTEPVRALVYLVSMLGPYDN